jgi:anaerobic ribonucleoside-triphosphate reductase activating protein
MRIAGIEYNSTVDGEGWRTAIFFQGCSHGCKGCHNPQTWDFSGGKEINLQELVDLIKTSCKENSLIDGVTLTGGDPFFQAEEIVELCKELKKENLNIWAYTGFIFDEFLNFKNNCEHNEKITQSMLDMLNYIDVVVDGPFIISKRTIEKPYVGSSNQRLIDVQKTLKASEVILYNLEE